MSGALKKGLACFQTINCLSTHLKHINFMVCNKSKVFHNLILIVIALETPSYASRIERL